MERLFAVFLGGQCKGARIEVHDVVFAVSKSIESAIPQIKKQWFGDPKSVHIDAWAEITTVDGHLISLAKSKTRKHSAKKLFFINIGSYQKGQFREEHDYFFFVCKNITEAKKRAKAVVFKRRLVHVDNAIEVDSIDEIQNVNNYTLEITPTVKAANLKINQKYWPI